MSSLDPLDPAEQRASEIFALLRKLPRDPWGRLKSERLRQLERIGLSMTSTLSAQDFEFLKIEIRNAVTANEARLENWRRISSGSQGPQ